jgi:predicted transcriptional regulator
MKTAEYLDAVRARLKLSSDYALAKALQITPQAVSNYRVRKTFGDDVAIRVADVLGIPRGKVLADMAAERAHSDEARKAWKEAARTIERAARAAVGALVALVITAAAMLSVPSSSEAATNQAVNAVQRGALCIMSTVRRLWLYLRRRLPRLRDRRTPSINPALLTAE